MSLFKKYPLTTYGFLDVFKTMSFQDDIFQSEDYTVYEINENDNLMSISYQYYETVEDWWIIFIFNKLDNYLFAIPNEKIINDTVLFYTNMLIDYETASQHDKYLIKVAIRNFFKTTYDTKTAIRKASEHLEDEESRNDEIFLIDFSEFIYNDIVMKSTYTTKLKIPSLGLVYKIKNYLKSLSIDWKNRLSQTEELG